MEHKKPELRAAPGQAELAVHHISSRRKFSFFALFTFIPLLFFATFGFLPGVASYVIDWLNTLTPGAGNYLIAWTVIAAFALALFPGEVFRWYKGSDPVGTKRLEYLRTKLLQEDVIETQRYRDEVLKMDREFTELDIDILRRFRMKYVRWARERDAYSIYEKY